MTSGENLRGGGRFSLTRSTDPPGVEKRGAVVALQREAQALRRLAGTQLAPRLLAATPGRIVTEHLDGAPRDLNTVALADLVALGVQLRRLHDHVTLRSGGRPQWPSRARSLTAYRRRRLADIGAPPPQAAAVAHQVRAAFDRTTTAHRRPFCVLHGDLVAANIVWTPLPRLVDWEFWRTGDPAEDLAYLFVVNALTPRREAAVLRGYGPAPATDRIDLWRAQCALDAAAWYLRHGEPAQAQPLLHTAARLSAPRPGAPSRR